MKFQHLWNFIEIGFHQIFLFYLKMPVNIGRLIINGILNISGILSRDFKATITVLKIPFNKIILLESKALSGMSNKIYTINYILNYAMEKMCQNLLGIIMDIDSLIALEYSNFV